MRGAEQVLHGRFGIGSVIVDQGDTIVVRFSHGIEECEKTALQEVRTPRQRLHADHWDVPLEVLNRAQAEAIVSVNDSWGVFSRSRIQLLPHQLWVCHQVNQQWPARWLVADDVGLGKTIEAGMILAPLLARGRVRRVLVLCPASLVDQWQFRLRTMFDIRMTVYAAELDTPRSDYWNTQNQVVASLQTMRIENEDRQLRLMESDPWDLLVVDEAHHLNADEQHGLTLGYKFVKRMRDEGRLTSMVFFTGTPHRGKNFGFLALLNLLRPDLFDAKRPMREQLPLLPQVMIRNNKSNVTDLKGTKLFQAPIVSSETYSYSPEERAFYEQLTEFITSGRAYASTLSQQQSRTVVLVLIAMQKLASSSVAAIRKALNGRLARFGERREKIVELGRLLRTYEEDDQFGLSDDVSKVEEQLLVLEASVRLMENEEPALRALLALAEKVRDETKIRTIMDVLRERFADRPILFFTEYKATQSLLMSALLREFGEGSVAFINGDDRAEDVQGSDGRVITLRQKREEAAMEFNSGTARFLISTEAGGEGIDLQERCHTLVHVDLPWNPMRLHQRVGRLNRYGQTRRVEVLSLRNPDTVESRIWDKLNEKLSHITLALGQVMDEPEDMLQLVLGMTSPTLFRELFSEAPREPLDSVGKWFDEKSASFGGRDVVQTVIDLVGHAKRFDFHEASEELPRVDLPDLKTFLDVALSLNSRRLREDAEGLTFVTPDAWKDVPAIANRYERMHLNRAEKSPDAAKRLLGAGHPVIEQALAQARKRTVSVATLPEDLIGAPLLVFRVTERITDEDRGTRSVTVGVRLDESGPVLLRDWELLRLLNAFPIRKMAMTQPSPSATNMENVEARVSEAERWLQARVPDLRQRFRYPEITLVSLFWSRPSAPDDAAEVALAE